MLAPFSISAAMIDRLTMRATALSVRALPFRGSQERHDPDQTRARDCHLTTAHGKTGSQQQSGPDYPFRPQHCPVGVDRLLRLVSAAPARSQRAVLVEGEPDHTLFSWSPGSAPARTQQNCWPGPDRNCISPSRSFSRGGLTDRTAGFPFSDDFCPPQTAVGQLASALRCVRLRRAKREPFLKPLPRLSNRRHHSYG